MDRLTASDLSMLWPDDLGWPQDIGVLAVLDADARRWRGSYLAQVRRVIESRLPRVPRFRQRVVRPRLGLGWPLWVDVPDVDVADHVGLCLVESPGDEARLLSAVEHLRRRPLDRSRPLWRLWLLPGLADGRLGLYIRVHHAIADGTAGVAMLRTLLDDVRGPPPTFAPEPIPAARELFEDNVRRRLAAAGRSLSALLHPAKTIGRVRAVWPAVRETLAGPRAPRTNLNTPIGPGRTVTLIRTRLDLVQAIGHRYAATVNDVLLAAVAGGLRELLLGRGERVDGVVLRAYVPVSLHRDGVARGNHDGMMAVSLPIAVSDPAARLRLIAAETAERKRRRRPPGAALLRNGVIQRILLPWMARQRMANVYVANVPGPREPLCLAGRPLLELFPVVPLIGNITVGVGALSYAGQFQISVVADRDACADIDLFASGLETALQCLSPEPALTGPAETSEGRSR
jgi:diacylglycerol O-acyltransferase / wax synthase